MHYVKTKREKISLCNICSQRKSLTWDHVPPKGGIELSTMEMDNLLDVFTRTDETKKIRESQNGLKYRTICKECNEFLGQKYDAVVNEFALSVGRYLKSGFKFPEIIHHKTKPQRLIKGILGHLIAAKAEYDDVVLDTQVREFILDENSLVPNNIYMFYWLYPYNCTIILRDFGMPSVRGNFKDFGFFHTLKYFPIAYLVSDKPRYEGLLELTKYRNVQIDEEVEIPIDLKRVEHFYWPEMVDNRNILFGGQSAVNAVTAVPKRMKQA
jgi:hypothetical protein